MQYKSNLIRIKRKTIIYFVVMLIALASVTPVLADYLGPNRTVTETTSACKVVLNECKYVPAKDDWRYKSSGSWSCSDENKPWQAYSSEPSSQGCFAGTAGDTYWEREETQQQATVTHPPATISGSLQNCTLNNGWCITAPRLSLSGNEPLSGYNIFALEGSLNGQTFACPTANCSVPLKQGNNNFTYWALSSWGDSSVMGALNAKVDSQLPNITGTFTGTSGTNSWYISPVSFNGSASDATSGLVSFTCTLDGIALPSCNTITVNNEGTHTLVLTARDNAGNTRNLSQNASIDTQNPLLNASLSGILGSNTWYTAAALNATASDPTPGSGLSAFEYNVDNSGWIAFSTSGVLDLPEGKHSVDIRVLDNAGLTVSASKPFWLDTAAPNIALDSSGTLGSNNWHISSINLTASADDATSGLDIFEYSLDNSTWTTYTMPLTLTDGTHNLSFWAQDEAGLVTQVDRTYYVDTRAPQITGSLSGVHGTNGWYISDVTLSASASDPTPGSGLDIFTYLLNGSIETPYTNALILLNGLNTIQLKAQDKAGLTYSTEQIIKVDTIYPSLNIQTTLPNWIKDSVTLNGTASDGGSGLSKVEISTDGRQTWQPIIDTTSWSYIWNTLDSSNGIHDVYVRATDSAGLTTERNLSTGVDNRGPKIVLPDSWFQWDTVNLDIWDNHSGLSEVRMEISDPEGRWPTRKIDLDPEQFPLDFKWDRRFRDGTVAPLGTYDVKVIAFDKLGNQTRQSASIKILLGILPAGPTATPQPYSRFEATQTPIYTATLSSSSVTTQTPVLSVFGSMPEPITQKTPIAESVQTPRATPTQTNVMDWLQSIFVPGTDIFTSVSEIVSLEESKNPPQRAGADGNVLWGATAAAMIGAATAYALEERRKQQEEEARQAALEEQKEERRKKIKARKMKKLEVKWAQERAWEEERLALQAQIQDAYSAHIETKMTHMEAKEDVTWMASQIVIQKREEAKKADELQAGLAAYYTAMRQGEKEAGNAQPNWWDNTKSFVKDKIVQPLNEQIYQPYIQPTIEKTKQFVINESSWINEKIYQPHIKPIVESTKQFVIHESSWINENIYQPHVKPVVEKTKQFVISESAWINENIYQPHVKPAVEKAKQFVIKESAWINEKIYQPLVKPVVTVINENIYQPYIQPLVNVINEEIYQPYFKPVVDDVSATWDKYGEWVHGSLDAAGLIPGLGEIADGLNGLIYLSEGRYIEASISAMAMIPILGDLGKAGKWSLTIGEEVLEEAAEKVAKEVAEELIEKVVKETGEELASQVAKESAEEVAEKILKEAGEELMEQAALEVAEKTTKEVADEVITRVSKDTIAAIPAIPAKNVSKTVADEAVEEALEQVNEETAQFIGSLTEQYGEEMVARFLPLCEKYGINPYDVLTRPPSEGQSLIGWVLGIENPLNPVNHSLLNLNLTETELDNILTQSIIRPDSKIVVLGYGGGSAKPYYTLSDEIKGCHLSLSAEAWASFENAKANFWTDINAPFLERAIEDRKIFAFNVNKSTIVDSLNAGRFSLPELKLIELPSNNYVRVEFGQYDLFVPQELQGSYLEHLPPNLIGE